ncbi:MAG: regulatory protein RecX [bacterium]
MPAITSISPQKKHRNRYSLFVDDQFYAGVDAAVVEMLGLKKGLQVEPGKLQTILEQEEYQQAKNYLFRLLSRRLYSCAEVRKKLATRDYEPKLIDRIITEFINQDWLNDIQFAIQWTESRLRSKPRGLALIRRELYQKGIDKEVIQDVLEKYTNPEAEFDRAIAALRKKKNYTSEPDLLKRKRKIYAYLARRGFNPETIEQTMSHFK